MIYNEDMKISKYASRIKKIRYKINDNNCWICISHCLSKSGYPKLVRNGKYLRMNRYIYKLEKGDIKNNNVVMHICDNPQCINPKHLKQGTVQENIDDRIKKGRGPLGTKNASSKLIKEDIIKIKNDDRLCREIAKDYPVNFSTIAEIKRGDSWEWV